MDRRSVHAAVNSVAIEAIRIHACDPDRVDVEVNSVRRRYLVAAYGDRVFLDGPDGSAELRELPRFPDTETADLAGSLAAPMPGKVIEVRVAIGDRVEAGAVLVILEAMKMEQKVLAPAAGVVSEIRAAAGDQIEAGRVLAVIDESA
jgi:propionyl-CoA carboxylase alpha chain